VLGRTGIQPGDIGALLLTHNHFDHAGCAGQFPGVHLYIQREEIDQYRAALRLPPRLEFLTRNCEPRLLDVLDERDRPAT
jgi:N-acyl homoserine lactone hydrolase